MSARRSRRPGPVQQLPSGRQLVHHAQRVGLSGAEELPAQRRPGGGQLAPGVAEDAQTNRAAFETALRGGQLRLAVGLAARGVSLMAAVKPLLN